QQAATLLRRRRQLLRLRGPRLRRPRQRLPPGRGNPMLRRNPAAHFGAPLLVRRVRLHRLVDDRRRPFLAVLRRDDRRQADAPLPTRPAPRALARAIAFVVAIASPRRLPVLTQKVVPDP